MKRTLLVIALVSLLLSGAKRLKLYRFTIINKAGMEIAVQLDGDELGQFYYLTIPTGDAASPAKRTFTLVPDTYAMQVYYLELWDPVYGASCNDAAAPALEVDRNLQMVFLECGVTPRRPGDNPQLKFGSGHNRRR
jgi:hypothetical protein